MPILKEVILQSTKAAVATAAVAAAAARKHEASAGSSYQLQEIFHAQGMTFAIIRQLKREKQPRRWGHAIDATSHCVPCRSWLQSCSQQRCLPNQPKSNLDIRFAALPQPQSPLARNPASFTCRTLPKVPKAQSQKPLKPKPLNPSTLNP